MTWPANNNVALAYIDQLKRSGAIEEKTAVDIIDKLNRAKNAMEKGGSRRLARQINGFKLPSEEQDVDELSKDRLERLGTILKIISEDLKN